MFARFSRLSACVSRLNGSDSTAFCFSYPAVLCMTYLPAPCRPRRCDDAVCRLLSSLFGKSGPGLKRVKPRVEMSLEAINRRELLKVLVTGVATTGEASVVLCCFCWFLDRCWCWGRRCCQFKLALVCCLLAFMCCRHCGRRCRCFCWYPCRTRASRVLAENMSRYTVVAWVGPPSRESVPLPFRPPVCAVGGFVQVVVAFAFVDFRSLLLMLLSTMFFYCFPVAFAFVRPRYCWSDCLYRLVFHM